MNESYWIDEVQKLENKVDELEEKLRVSDKLDELVWCECNRSNKSAHELRTKKTTYELHANGRPSEPIG